MVSSLVVGGSRAISCWNKQPKSSDARKEENPSVHRVPGTRPNAIFA